MEFEPVQPLFLQVDRGGVVASSPRISQKLRVTARVAKVLLDAISGLDTDEERNSCFLPVVEQLHRLGYLVERGTCDDRKLPSPWREWGPLAWEFHERTRDIPFVARGTQEHAQWSERLAAADPPPHRHRDWGDRDILLLPRVRSNLRMAFEAVLECRRTHRAFMATPVGLDDFSTILHYTLGPIRFADGRDMGVLELRANASGGARHETDGYIVIHNVSEIEPGLYFYDSIRHGLLPVRDDVSREQLEELTGRQGFYTTCAFGVITVADARRMAWKYQNARAYRHLMHNVGTVVQVFSMVATALGLGAAITGAIQDTAMDRLLRLDRPHEFATFSLSCGRPVLRPDGLPEIYRAPQAPFPSRPSDRTTVAGEYLPPAGRTDGQTANESNDAS